MQLPTLTVKTESTVSGTGASSPSCVPSLITGAYVCVALEFISRRINEMVPTCVMDSRGIRESGTRAEPLHGSSKAQTSTRAN